MKKTAVWQTSFGTALKNWRLQRKLSQLELSLQSTVSQRHISFLESGRSQPSREMVLQLSEAMDVPLRQRNLLLGLAGFSPLYRERDLQGDELSAVRQALEMSLAHHDPFPAIVVNKDWDLLMGNAGAELFFGALGPAETVWSKVDPGGSHNVLRFTFHPEGLQPYIRNWEQVVTVMLNRLQRDCLLEGDSGTLSALLEEVCAYPGMPESGSLQWAQPPPPILPIDLDIGGVRCSLFSMISTFGTAQDITADELRIEAFFPADEQSRQLFDSLEAEKASSVAPA